MHSGEHRSRRIQSGSLVFTRARLEVAVFIQVRSKGSLVSLGFAWLHSEVEFSFRFACVPSGAHSGHRVDSGSLVFTQRA